MTVSNFAHSASAELSTVQHSPLLGEEALAVRSLTALERIELLLDSASYVELDCQIGDVSDDSTAGLLAATGYIGTTLACVFAQDHRAANGVLNSTHLHQIKALQKMAIQQNMQLIGIFDGQSLSISGGLGSMLLAGEMATSTAQGKALSVALVLGQNTGFNAVLASLFDVVVMTRSDSSLTLSNAIVTSRVTGTQLQESELGGWKAHAQHSGLADVVCDNEVLAIREIRRLFHALTPTNRAVKTPIYAPAFDTLIPSDDAISYDVRELLYELSDERTLFQFQAEFAPHLITAITRINNIPVGIIASQNVELAGVLDVKACRKAVNLLRICEKAGLPIISIVDTPGFLPGEDQEHAGIAYEVAELVRAYSCFSAPRITLVINKLFGATALALCARGVGTHVVAGWTEAQIGLIGDKGAQSLAEVTDDELQRHQASLQGAHALRAGYIDALIKPGQTRQWLAKTLSLLQTQKDQASAT